LAFPYCLLRSHVAPNFLGPQALWEEFAGLEKVFFESCKMWNFVLESGGKQCFNVCIKPG